VSGYPGCLDCGVPVKFRHRDRCHVSHRSVARAAAKRGCPQCGQLRHLQPSGMWCGTAPRKPPKTIACVRCGEQRRRARSVQPVRARRPGSSVPLRRLDGRSDARSPVLVGGARRIRRRALPPQWRSVDSAPHRAACDRGTGREPAAGSELRHARGCNRRAGAACTRRVLHRPRACADRRRGATAGRRTSPQLVKFSV
jgi:hypothetical protein